MMIRIDKGAPSVPQEPSDRSEVTDQSARKVGHHKQMPAMDTWSSVADAHGCPCCPHPGTGLFNQSAPDFLINSRPAPRKAEE